jgi:hypothetical protein
VPAAGLAGNLLGDWLACLSEKLVDHHDANQAQLKHGGDDRLLPRRQYGSGTANQESERCT